MQVGEYGDKAAEDDEGVSGDDDPIGAMRDAELAAFADLDPEARRLVLDAIAGSVSDDEDDEESAGLAAALMAEAERLEQLESARAEQNAAAHAEDSRHGSEEAPLDDAGSINTSSREGGGSSNGVHSSAGSSSRQAVDASEAVHHTVISSDVTTSAEQLGSRTQTAEDASAILGPPELLSAGITEPADSVENEEDAVDWEQRDPEAVAACVGASGDWSRIVRRAIRLSMLRTLRPNMCRWDTVCVPCPLHFCYDPRLLLPWSELTSMYPADALRPSSVQ